jgi:hypothetical protein
VNICWGGHNGTLCCSAATARCRKPFLLSEQNLRDSAALLHGARAAAAANHRFPGIYDIIVLLDSREQFSHSRLDCAAWTVRR